jgi:hypothetical protein
MSDGRFRLDRHARLKVGDSVDEPTEPEAAKAVVEVGPKILRPQVERTLERLSGLFNSSDA